MTSKYTYKITDSTLEPRGREGKSGKVYLDLKPRDYFYPLCFLLCMSLCGLKLMPFYLIAIIIMMSRWKTDRYDFMIMSAILLGGFGLTGEDSFFIKTFDIALIAGLIGVIVLKKPHVVKKMLVIWGIYCVALFILCTFSDESLLIQFRTYRTTTMFVTFTIWIMIFSSKPFSLDEFFRKLAPYIFIICAFYILDCFVINGHILLPRTFSGKGIFSTFMHPLLYGFGAFPRKYPPGLFLLALFAYPLARTIRLRMWQWLLILFALFASRTFTVIMAVTISYIIALPNTTKTLRYAFGGLILFATIYSIDSSLPHRIDGESMLRVQSSIDQLTSFNNDKMDEVDLSEVGSGRFAQAMPKIELLYELDKEWTGFGFLHPELTKKTKYIIINPFYRDQSSSEEVAILVEISLVQVFMYVGYIGLALHLLFLFLSWFIIRKCRDSGFYLNVMVCVLLLGVGGFAPTITSMGLFLLGWAWSIVYLSNKPLKSK